MSEGHKTLHKTLGLNSTEMRTARTSNFVQLRKQKRENNLQGRRNMLMLPTNGNENSESSPHQLVLSEELLQKLHSNEEPDLLQAIREFSIQLSQLPHTDIGEMIHKHLMERFVEILKNNTDNTLHSEVISMLNNIASNSPHQIAILTDSGAVPVFLGLLSSSYHKVQEDAMWALGNIAFESLMNRDLLLDSGIMVPLLHLLSSCPNVSVIRRSVWTFANLARWRNPPLDSTQISQSMFILQGLLQHKDPDILVDACLTVCYLSNEREQVQAVVDADICRHLVKLLVHPDRGVCTAALRAVGNVFHGTDEQIQVVLDLDALPCISQLMHYSSCIIRKEACRSIANIATGSSAQIQKIIDANIFPQMLKMIKTADSKTSKEIIRSLANASTFGKSNQTHYLFLINSLPLVCDFLTIDDSSVILLALKTLENILRVGDDYQILPNPYALAIEECGGLEKIEYLQTHENLEIYHKSFNLIDQFFEDEDDDMRMHPVAGIDQFEFSAQNLPEGSFDF